MKISVVFLAVSIGAFTAAFAEDPAPASKKLPPQPWHLADIWWDFAAPTPHFETLDIDVTIDRDVPSTVNLYVSPCGLGQLSGQQFYGGLQTNANGWPSKTEHTRAFIGKGGIFSRWGKNSLSVDWARGAEGTHFESAGYEGDFVSVRRAFAWTKGTYTWSLRACDTETIDGKDYTWVSCFVTPHDVSGTGITGASGSRYIGSLRFEGKDLTFWPRHSAFVEVYSTAKIPHSEIPEVTVTFGYPRINGQQPQFKKASVIHPAAGERSGAPDCATAEAEGDTIVVKVGKVFDREAKDRRHGLELKQTAAEKPAQ
ncbi:MAG TPA: hypothetical protein VKX17_01520 [Planctomycetota bacterium]|nr:hypothetical protein [Planctomycetota bacterium]